MVPDVAGVKIHHEGATVAFLLVHGFCAAPDEMITLGEFLSDRNISSFAVQISGHNSTPDELRQTSWHDWYESVINGLELIKSWNTKHVFVAGLSMGGALSILLAAEHNEIGGLILLAPALKINGFLPRLVQILKYMIKDREVDTIMAQERYDRKRTKYAREPISAYHELFKMQKVARKEMHRVKVPTLIIQGTADKTIDPKNGQIAFNCISSVDKQLFMIESGEHVITCHTSRHNAYPLIEEFIKKNTQKD